MPSESAPNRLNSSVHVTACVVMDFFFGLYLLAKRPTHPEKHVPSWVDDVSLQEPALIDELLQFWRERELGELPDGTPYFEYGELLVAAWRAGVVFAPVVEALLDSLESTLTEAFETPRLESEPPAVWDVIDRRLAVLRGSAEARHAYAGILRRVWTLMRPVWDRGGKAAAERASRELLARLRPDMDLRELVPGNQFLHRDNYQSQIERARARGDLYVVALGLSGGGQLYWSLPGMLVVGTGPESEEREVERRVRAERVANRLKVLSDPTRVAILFELLRPSSHASTVTELASLFGLSQPTVSVHVKALREAGLITSSRDGNQVLHAALEPTVRAYMEGTITDILGGKPVGRSGEATATTAPA